MDNRQQMYGRYNRMGQQQPRRNCGSVPPNRVEAERECPMKAERRRCIDSMPLAMAYVPMQRWENVCDAPSGLAQGTIFKDLVMPYCPLLRKRGGR